MKAQERGQARLPDPELILVERDLSLEGFQRLCNRSVPESQGREGGLAPALIKIETSRVRAFVRRHRIAPA